jgi:hypothetical protein
MLLNHYIKDIDIKKSNQGLISDDPIEPDEENDSFDRKKYAQSIVSEIRKTVNKRAFNIAITGAWGSGKTSFLNLIKGEMDKEVEAEKVKFITVNYNPWDFKEDKIMGLDLLKTISYELANEKELQEKFKGLMVSLQGVDQSPWYKVIPYFLSGFSEEKSIDGYRKEIGNILGLKGQKLVIFLDDLDRLDGDEILEVFKTIRNSFDIANTFFILGFDIEYVTDQIKDKVKGSDQNVRALEYLEKIFQMRLNMPSNVDFDYIEKLEKETGIIIDESAKYHCDKFFKIQYRDAIKIINGIKIFKAYAKYFDDFNSTGLIMLEILKLKNPSIYNHFVYELGYLIPKQYLQDYYSGYKYKNINPSLSGLYIGIKVDEYLETPLKYILYFILPDIYNSKTFALDYNKYFKFSLPQSFISTTEMEKALKNQDFSFFEKIKGTSKEFHLRHQIEMFNLKLSKNSDIPEFAILTLFKVNASIVPLIKELATTHHKFITTFKSYLELPEIYQENTLTHYIKDLEDNQKLFFSSRYWFLDKDGAKNIINEIIIKYNVDQDELVFIYAVIHWCIAQHNAPNMIEQKQELIKFYKVKLKETLNEFSLNWLKPFVFSKSMNNNHTHFSFFDWLFTSEEVILLMDKDDPKHAELIRWLKSEFLIEKSISFILWNMNMYLEKNTICILIIMKILFNILYNYTYTYLRITETIADQYSIL